MTNIKFKLNGKDVDLNLDPSMRFLDVLRNHFGLTGPKEGCGEGECGACAVLLDGHIVHSCCLPLANVEGKEIVTIEGFTKTKRYQALADAILEEGGSQCGICTPGMMIAAESLLNQNPKPSEDEIRIGLSGNLCRCTGYNMIVKAVKTASKKGDGLW
ncbi:(2Fe-2S)-binding protein [Mariniplasma anaerobium]|uniref:(2Fe-2S)-binding protein n=1 Tax=Mariniplasma anaerobium TaxID=2735436 RepID=A0A7U9XWT3_9MOLU|nr:(2Fe-2S)-binding protein [Mariniplasma anaerobium]BCR36729.1 (2Fe-2S)-binding protein [Mariniplasma anaerobium]